nr:helix-turn-helix domain-containing protein [uncultured Rhodopila sp.]
MQAERFDTADVPKADQYEAWLRWFDRVFDVDPGTRPEHGFHATSEIWALEGCALSRVTAPPVRVTRTRTLIRRNPLDPWVITIGRHTTSSMLSGGREFEARPGVPFVVSLGNELISRREQDERLHLYLSRDAFSDIAPIMDAARGAPVDTAMGALLADYMLMLERRLPNIPTEDLPRLKEAISATVAACVAPAPDRVAEATEQLDLGRLERVRCAVRKHLRSPSLGPRLLCRYVGTSRSQLYRLLESEGGVARYIQRQRLLAAYAILCDPSADKPIATIAEEFCFADASGFSRAFRQEFDTSPSDLRTASRVGARPSGKATIVSRSSTLNDLLRAS